MVSKEKDEIVIDLQKILSLLWRHAAIIVAITLACGVLGYCVSAFVMSPTYSASADMIVNNKQGDANSMTSVSNADLVASSSLVNTYSVILKSHNVLEQVIQDLELDMTYAQLSAKVVVSAVDSTQVMRITVRDGDPQRALDIVSRIVELAPDAIMDAMSAGSVKTVDNPYTSGMPVAPSKKGNTAFAALIGLLLCVAVIVVRELLNDAFQSEEDVRRILGLPVLGVIPLETTPPIKGGSN